MYALAMLLAVAALAAMLAYLREGRWRDLVAYVLLCSAGPHTIYLFVLVPGGAGPAGLLAFALRAGAERRWRVLSWIGANIAVALSPLPWLWSALPYKPERFQRVDARRFVGCARPVAEHAAHRLSAGARGSSK